MSDFSLVFGTLVQESALSVGGSEAEGLADRYVARDGRGRLVIPGRAIAGALIAMAKRFYPLLPDCVSAGWEERPDDRGLKPSVWHPFNSHPVRPRADQTAVWAWCEPHEVPTELRQGVGIRQDTGARAHGILYEVECVPAGTRWSFLLEIRTREAGELGPLVEAMAVRVLQHWSQGRCWLGGAVARGLGWLRLADARLLRVTGDLWPDSFRPPEEVLAALVRRNDIEVIEGDCLWRIADSAPPQRSWFFVDIRGTFAAGDDPDGYGIDPIAVGASSVTPSDNGPALHHLVRPEGCSSAVVRSLYQTDRPIAMARHADGSLRPFIPGSGLRGPLRHALSRLLRQKGEEIRDPNWRDDTRKSGLPGTLFGTTSHSARLLVRDAYTRGDDWVIARVQHHAEDEFAGGPYASAKFDAAVLLRGEFEWRMVLEGSDKEEVSKWTQALRALIGDNGLPGLGTLGHLPVGGLKWRGAGWGRWTLEVCETVAVEPDTAEPVAGTEVTGAARRQESNWEPKVIQPERGVRGYGRPAAQETAGGFMGSFLPVRIVEDTVQIEVVCGHEKGPLTLGRVAEATLPGAVAWWIEPKADPALSGQPVPVCFGWGPVPSTDRLLDQVIVSMEDGVWRALRTGPSEYRWVRIREVRGAGASDSSQTTSRYNAKTRTWPVVLRRDWNRFATVPQIAGDKEQVRVTEYIVDGRTIAFRWEV